MSWRRISLASAVDFAFNIDIFMQDQSFRYAFPMLDINYWRILCDNVSLFTQVFIVSSDRVHEKCWWLSLWDMTVPLKCNVLFLWFLTYQGQIVLTKCLGPHMCQGFSNLDPKLKFLLNIDLGIHQNYERYKNNCCKPFKGQWLHL